MNRLKQLWQWWIGPIQGWSWRLTSRLVLNPPEKYYFNTTVEGRRFSQEVQKAFYLEVKQHSNLESAQAHRDQKQAAHWKQARWEKQQLHYAARFYGVHLGTWLVRILWGTLPFLIVAWCVLNGWHGLMLRMMLR